MMEKLQSQLPQPLKRCSPSRHTDLLTQIKNTNSPGSQRSQAARRTMTSSHSNPRSRASSLNSAEVKPRSPEITGRTREAATKPAARRTHENLKENVSNVTVSKLNRQQLSSDSKQSPAKNLAVRMPGKSKAAQVRTLRTPAESNHYCDDTNYSDDITVDCPDVVSKWTQNGRPTTSGVKKPLSPASERRGEGKRLENSEADEEKNNGSGSPIYHELDPPGSSHLNPVQHTYQSIVEINDELESLRSRDPTAPDDPASEKQRLSRAKSAQELAQKSPTKLSLFSRFRFSSKKSAVSSAGKNSEVARGKVDRPGSRPAITGVRGQRSLQDDDLISRSRDQQYGEVGVASSHDRQPSFTTFACRVPRPGHALCDEDGYSCVYVSRADTERSTVPVPPRTSSLSPTRLSGNPLKPSPEPLYRKKFLKIASVHTLEGSNVDDDARPAITSSNSVGDLLLASQSPKVVVDRVTSYDDHAVSTGSRKMTSETKSRIARYGMSPGQNTTAFSSPSCGVRMAAMRGAVRRSTTDTVSRSPSSSTPVPSPAGFSVFQFNVPPAGVMTSPPVQRAFKHVSSQTVVTVRPPCASCVLNVTMVHGPNSGPPGQMQTIEEEEDFDNELNEEPVHQTDVHSTNTSTGDTELTSETVNGLKTGWNGNQGTTDDSENRPQRTELVSGTAKSSKLRRPTASVLGSKPHSPRSASPLVDQQSPKIISQRQTESTSSFNSLPASRSSDQNSVRRSLARGQQPQQRKLAAPPADSDAANVTATQLDEGLSAPWARSKLCSRRLLVPAETGSPTPSSGSTVSLLSTGSEVEGPSGTSAPETGLTTDAEPKPPSRLIQPKHSSSSVASRVSKITELTVLATDHVNY